MERPRTIQATGILAALSLLASGAAAAPNVSTPANVSHGVIVEMSPGSSPSDRREVARELSATTIRGLGGQGLYLFERLTATTKPAAERALADLPAVESVDLDLPATAAGVPNDPCFIGTNSCPVQYGSQDDMRVISLPAALDRLTLRTPTTVAVIDTSIGLDHPDLQGRLWSNPAEAPNGIDDDGNGFIDDIHGADWVSRDGNPDDTTGQGQHGTHVAGTIAAVVDNGIGIAGIAPGARIMSLRFLGDNSGGATADAILAINYAVANGAKVINNSWVAWSSTKGHHGVCTAMRAALEAGVVVVSAAGNNAIDVEDGKLFGSTLYWPIPATCFDSGASDAGPQDRATNGNGQITVAATDNDDAMPGFTNWSTQGSVDMSAPGYQVLSTMTNLDSEGSRQNTYKFLSGTSMAAPHVAGAAALLLGERPLLSGREVRAAILEGAAAAPSTAGKTASARRLDLTGMLTHASVTAPDRSPPAMGALSAPADGWITRSRTVGLSWGAASDASPVTYDVFLNGVRLARDLTSTSVSATVAEGRHAWFVVARDSAGNSATSASRMIVVDETPPAPISSVSPDDGVVIEPGPLAVSWSAPDDPLSGVAEYDVLVDRRLVGRVPAGVTNFTLPTQTTGYHDWAITARDAAGNEGMSGPWGFTVASPQSPPVVTQPPLARPSPGWTAPTPRGMSLPGQRVGLTIGGGVRTTRSRSVQVQVVAPTAASHMRTATSAASLASAPWAPVASSSTVMLPAAPGREVVREVHLEVIGQGGASLGTATDDIVLDTAAPQGRVTKVAGGKWRLRARDASGPWRFQFRGGRWRTATGNEAALAGPPGAGAVRFRDALGNTGGWMTLAR